ncbi:MAG TPA: hypothetical protein VKS60_20045 [Stellaceae bacterium]|nr:hypothetical protein [Stellaceae bacterium]
MSDRPARVPEIDEIVVTKAMMAAGRCALSCGLGCVDEDSLVLDIYRAMRVAYLRNFPAEFPVKESY